jgi:hypothetical protein
MLQLFEIFEPSRDAELPQWIKLRRTGAAAPLPVNL